MSTYEEDQKRLERLMNEVFSNEQQEVSPDDENEELEEDHVEVNEESSDTEQEFEDVEEDSAEYRGPVFLGKDKKTIWNKHAPSNIKTKSKNIIKIKLPFVGRELRNLQTPLELWRSFFDDDIINIIVTHTNEYLESVKDNYGRETYTRKTDKVEIEALLGLLLLAGVKKCNHLNAEDLFQTNGTAPELFRTTMSLQRFRMLIRFLRFDDIQTREERRKTDKLAPIRAVFDKFVNNCKQNYNMSYYVTVDEKLEAFRGRCPFRQYMPLKPNKYGIKIFALCDAKMFYTYNLEVYVGTQPEGPFSRDNTGMAIVQRLCEPIYGSRRNVTTDRWFTSFPLAEYLLQQGLTTIGTIRCNKRELPPEFVQRNTRPIGSSMFGFGDNCTIVSYIPKKNKNVLLISTCHDDDKIDLETNKPEIILDYNRTKSGVDVVDQLSANYNCARPTRRWQMVVFYSLLNISGINSQVIHAANTSEKILRRKFLEGLALSLIEPHLKVRVQLTNLPKTIRLRISEICKIPLPQEEAQQERRLLGRCAECGHKKNRKTKYCCRKCNKFLCLEHISVVCHNCYCILNTRE